MAWLLQNERVEDWTQSYCGPKFHAVLCDPPYGLEFMGKEWDAPHKATSIPKPGNIGGFADGNKPSFARQKAHLWKLAAIYESWGEALLPHLYPGALVLMFGGTRTWEWLAVGMQMAGYEKWDTLLWLYGQGFPKAQKVKAEGFEGHKTCALKPSWEPVLCFRAPTGRRTYAQLAREFGSGCLNVDGGRIAVGDEDYARNCSGDRGHADNRTRRMDFAQTAGSASDIGRYPSNLALDPEAAELLDLQSGELASGDNPTQRHSDITRGIYGEFKGHDCFPARAADTGGASRFFYCAKADREERDRGVDGPKKMLRWSSGDESPGTFQAEGTDRFARNHHPTVKPIDLCAWLAKLLLPPAVVKPCRLLVPFAGSGSEMVGALRAGWDEVIGVEQDQDICAIARQRIEGDAPLLNIQSQAQSESTEASREHPLPVRPQPGDRAPAVRLGFFRTFARLRPGGHGEGRRARRRALEAGRGRLHPRRRQAAGVLHR